MSAKTKAEDEEMPLEYHFDYSKGVPGKYCQRLEAEGSNVVLLDPDVAEAFHTSEAVNEALRALLRLSQTTTRLTAALPGQTGPTR